MGRAMAWGIWPACVEETVINNYYDEPGRGAEHGGYEHGGGEHHIADSGNQFSDQGGAQLSDAGNDQGDNLRGFDQGDSASASDFNDSVSGDQSAFGDGTSLDSGFDDGGGFDSGDIGSGGI